MHGVFMCIVIRQGGEQIYYEVAQAFTHSVCPRSVRTGVLAFVPIGRGRVSCPRRSAQKRIQGLAVKYRTGPGPQEP